MGSGRCQPKGKRPAKNYRTRKTFRLYSEGGVRFGRGSRTRAPRDFNEQRLAEDGSPYHAGVGRGVPPSRQTKERYTTMNSQTQGTNGNAEPRYVCTNWDTEKHDFRVKVKSGWK